MINTKEIQKLASNFTVLYVEDEEKLRDRASVFLNKFFKEVTLASNGKEGLELYNGQDIVITDINMPKMNGLEMSKQIKSINNSQNILIVSAYSDADYLIESIKIGVDGYVLKPIDNLQFQETIYKILEKIKNNQDVKELSEKQAKLASLGKMMDAIAHQWKQPLSFISTLSSSLSMKIENDMEVTYDDIVNNSSLIIKQIDHLVETIDDFRDFFRPNRMIEHSSVKHLIDSVLNLMQITLMKENIRINLKCDETIKINVISNEFKHVFINLINNSKDAYSTLDKEVEKNINIDVLGNNEAVIIEFKDNAGGIPLNIIDNVFVSNFTTKADGKGSGIGLFMTKQIIEKFGGSVEVYNSEDGACFKMTLPYI